MTKIRPFRAQGFTLTEMAVALVIIALLVGGLLLPLSAQRNVEARRDTVRAMESIREALLGYALAHGRLPCPADGSIASGTVNAGREAAPVGGNCTCTTANSGIAANSGTPCAITSVQTTVSGVVPWATLGLPESDGWGNRYTYLVTTAYARSIGQSTVYCDSGSTLPTPPTNAAFALCTSGSAKLFSAADLAVALTTDNEVPAIVVSHGDNGLGAWLSNGTQKAGAAGDELVNANGNAVFVSNTGIDDLLTWLSRPILMNRMIAAGKLP
jgi:prepilin-type N-terminal cleavage/methylation domain-containing protein